MKSNWTLLCLFLAIFQIGSIKVFLIGGAAN
jgi:cyanophycinase